MGLKVGMDLKQHPYSIRFVSFHYIVNVPYMYSFLIFPFFYFVYLFHIQIGVGLQLYTNLNPA